jgi:hypothetical protein
MVQLAFGAVSSTFSRGCEPLRCCSAVSCMQMPIFGEIMCMQRNIPALQWPPEVANPPRRCAALTGRGRCRLRM